MKILVTGSAGMVGQIFCQSLSDPLPASKFEVVEFDLVNGEDVLNFNQLQEKARGCQAIVHCAADLGHEGHAPLEILRINLLGLNYVLEVARREDMNRVVFVSSAAALGIFAGEGVPLYLPIDDAHPANPASPYALSKKLGEELCQQWTSQTGIPTICLRPPGIFDAQTYEFIHENRQRNPSFEWEPYWEYGAFLDVRDMATAIHAALGCPVSGHHTLLLCADDISSAHLESQTLAQQIMPEVEWRGDEKFEASPFRALIDTSQAHEILSWKPQHKWRD